MFVSGGSREVVFFVSLRASLRFYVSVSRGIREDGSVDALVMCSSSPCSAIGLPSTELRRTVAEPLVAFTLLDTLGIAVCIAIGALSTDFARVVGAICYCDVWMQKVGVGV